jgi:uncharacterized repeat protein (TIGR01451 family)
MNKLITWTGLFLASLFAMQSHGAGTGAGTTISNTASVSYEVGGATVTEDSDPVTITVQELINVTVVSQDSGNVSLSSPQTGAELKFQVTNTGNGNEAFIINQVNIGGDEFDVTLSTIYLDSGANDVSDGVFDPNVDTVYDNSAPPAISPDGSITIWVTSDIPDSLSNSDTSEVQVSALSKTFSDDGQDNPDAGAFVTGGGDSSTDAVYGSAAANADDTATFVVSAIEVSIVKAIGSITDQFGTSQPVPGAEVVYSLTVTVTGTGDAENVTVTDPLPDELLLKGGVLTGIITVDGVDMSAGGGDDDASYDANTNTISVLLNTVTAGSGDIEISFTTEIQ